MEPKKPVAGARDLSDLKAKLGLVKPSAAAPAPAQPTPDAAAPPAAPAPAAAPAPPPDPKRDPFAQVQARPAAFAQPVVISDAGPLLAVPEARKSRAPIVIAAAVAVAVAAISFGFGTVYRARVTYNLTTDQAAQIKGEVAGIRKRSQPIYEALFRSFQKTKGATPDLDLIDALEQLATGLEPPKTEKIFKTNYAQLENLTIDRLFNYYNNTIRLYDASKRFVRDAKNARADLEKVLQRAADARTTYGIVIDGSGDIPLGMLVQVGTTICKDGQEANCPANEIDKFNVRTDVTGRWMPRKARGTDAERVVPIKPDTPLAQKALAGGIEMMAFRHYQLQLVEMHELARSLGAVEKELVDDLSKAANRPKVFTF